MPKTPPKPQSGGQKYHDGIPALVRSIARRSERGLTDAELAKKIGVAVRTIHRWKKEHPEFRDALIETKAVADARVELSLFRRATGYSVTKVEVTTENGVETKRVTKTEEIAPDVQACRLWLMNRDPDNWRDKQQIEHSGEITIDDARAVLLARLRSMVSAPEPEEEPAP